MDILKTLCIKQLTCASEDLGRDVELDGAFPDGLLRPLVLTMIMVVTRHKRGAAAEDVKTAETLQRPTFLLGLLVLGSPVPSAAAQTAALHLVVVVQQI